MPKAKKPTTRDMAVFEALRARQATNAVLPSRRELSADSGIPLGTVHGSLARLKRFGLATWDKGIPRSIRLTEPANA